MKRQSLKHVLLTLAIVVLTLSWVGSVSGFPGMMGQWSGFHASEKGFPGWGQEGQDVGDDLELRATTVEPGVPGYLPGEGFEGAQQGNYPGHRPNGK